MSRNEPDARAVDRERAKQFVRDILTNDFKQKADDALVDNVALKMLKALPSRDH